jgi:hypothetical protein
LPAVIGLATPATAAVQRRRSARVWWLSYAGVAGITLIVAAVAVLTAPAPLSLAGFVLLVLAVVVVVRPELGLWFIAFLAVAGDSVTVPWYPFAKGFSASESILFVSDSITVSPLEMLLAATAVGWFLRMAASRRWELRRGALFRPIVIFTLFVVFGLAIGIGRGGNTNIALWEVRPLLSLVVIYVLATNLVERPESYRRLWSALMAAVVIDSLFAIYYYFGLSSVARTQADHLGEHPAALHANAFFILMAAMGVMSARSTRRLVVLLVATPIVGYAYLLGQRRSAFVGLLIGVAMVAVVLYRRRPLAFWYVMPLLILVFAGYLVVFWNSTGVPGFPAQAVKSVAAPSQLSEEDKSSDQFRVIENYNIVYTIRWRPLTGIGFGQQYLRPIPNADISFAQWWEYRTHNSVLWIWMQTGVGGFLAMLYLVAAAVRHGTRRVMRAPVGYDAALVLSSVVFVVMYSVFAYVDIAWDAQSMVILGIAFACIASDTLHESQTATDSAGSDNDRLSSAVTRPL